MLIKFFGLVIVVLLFTNFAFSQTNPVDFSISLADGKKVYRMGEPIEIVLNFVVKKPNYKVRMDTGSPYTEKIKLTPSDGFYDWKNRQTQLFGYWDDVLSFYDNYDKPVNIKIFLNDFVRFEKSGKYSLTIDTSRIYYSDSDKPRFSPKHQVASTVSNTIDFEIQEMNEAEEKEEISRLTALIDTEKDSGKRFKYAQAFSFLTGDASTLEKVNRYLKGTNQDNLTTGLLIARNRNLVTKLLEDAFNDLNREVQIDLIFMLIQLKLLAESDNLSQTNGNLDSVEKGFRYFEENKQPYIQKLADSLSVRTGKSQITAAYTVFTNLRRNDTSSAAFNISKSIILQHFDELHPFAQDLLLSAHWEKIQTPEIIPLLERVLTKTTNSDYHILRGNALNRLIELAPQKARSYVIIEIKSPVSYINAEILSRLEDKYLPEIDESLLKQIREAANKSNRTIYLPFKTHLAARFATKKVYQDLLQIYSNYGHLWNEDELGGLLAYFLRHNAKEAIPMVEERLAKFNDLNSSAVLSNVIKPIFSKGTKELLSQQLNSDNPHIAGTAAFYLARYGEKNVKKIIEKRYQRWLKKWLPRKDEFVKTNNKNIQAEKMAQVNMVEALKNAKSWKLTEKELNELKQTCLSEECLKYFPKN